MAPRKVKGVLAVSRMDLLSMDERLKLFSNIVTTVVDGVDTDVADAVLLRAADAGAATSSAAAASDAAAYSSTASSKQTDGRAAKLKPPMRDDHPVVKHFRRGAAETACDQVSSRGMGRLIEYLRVDRFAASVKGKPASRVETWSRFHHQAFGDLTPVFPITVAKMEAVAACSKQGSIGPLITTCRTCVPLTLNLAVSGRKLSRLQVPGWPVPLIGARGWPDSLHPGTSASCWTFPEWRQLYPMVDLYFRRGWH